mmetsp:Transcript_4135/g.9865  ORF Transcript_4135/g.9865 Transcript_4135/m.9865 type:complete len:257 (+) Transcript_4135:39-809(+)
MNNSRYSQNCIVYSNDGKILQLEYAQKGAKKGKCSFGFSSGNHTILFLIDHKFKTTRSESNEIDIVSKNSAMLRSGITGDGIYISGFIKKKNYEYYYINKKFCPGSKLTIECSEIFSSKIFSLDNRPFGSNILFANFDLFGPTLTRVFITGKRVDLIFFSQGLRSYKIGQYLIKNFPILEYFSLDELFFWCFGLHLKLLSIETSNKFLHIYFKAGMVGKNTPFLFLTQKIKFFLLNNLTSFKKKLNKLFLRIKKKS